MSLKQLFSLILSNKDTFKGLDPEMDKILSKKKFSCSSCRFSRVSPVIFNLVNRNRELIKKKCSEILNSEVEIYY